MTPELADLIKLYELAHEASAEDREAKVAALQQACARVAADTKLPTRDVMAYISRQYKLLLRGDERRHGRPQSGS